MSKELDKAREIGAKIVTELQSKQAILTVLATLRKAVETLNGFSVTALITGEKQAWIDRIDMQLNRVGTLQSKPFTRLLADQIGLSIVQTAILLDDLKKSVAESNRYSIDNLITSFKQALIEILERTANAIADAGKKVAKNVIGDSLPWVYAGLGGLVIYGLIRAKG